MNITQGPYVIQYLKHSKKQDKVETPHPTSPCSVDSYTDMVVQYIYCRQSTERRLNLRRRKGAIRSQRIYILWFVLYLLYGDGLGELVGVGQLLMLLLLFNSMQHLVPALAAHHQLLLRLLAD